MRKPQPSERRPPHWADHLLEWFCAPHLLEEVQGDLQELYGKWVKKHGVKKAQWLYVLHAIKFFRPYNIKRLSLNNPTDMLKNYFIIALRNLLKQKLYSFLNIGGLAVGLACFILILLFVQHELSYDRFHEKGDQIYRVVQERPTSTGLIYWAETSPALANALLEEFPEVIMVTTVGQTDNPLLTLGDDHYQEEGILADARFFDIFTFPLLRGNPKEALVETNSIVLTETLAHKIFGDEDPMGQTLLYQNGEAHIVTGIIADVPETSHLQFSYILPAQSHVWYRNGLDKPIWYNNGWYTYVVLSEGAEAGHVEEKLRALIEVGLADWRPEDRMKFMFQPLADIHLHSGQMSTFSFEKSGDIKYVYLFSFIGFVILLLACINYTNLAIARSIKRAREVGLRKVIGAAKGQLISQFLGESVFMAFLALMLALVVAPLLLPFFGHLLERPLAMDYLDNGLLLPGLLLLVLLVGLLSGSYPAFFMVSLRPVQALAGKQQGRISHFWVQRWLIVGQYAVSIILVVGSMVVHEQMQFMRNQELGYDREHILTIQANDPALSQKYSSLRNAWLRDSRVVEVSYSAFLPTDVDHTQGMFGWEGSSEGELLSTTHISVDYDFLNVYGIELVAGRGFSRTFGTDTLGAPIALINEATAHVLGWAPEEALGKQFGYTDGRGRRTIIGVIKDFHFNSIHSALGPLVLTLDRNPTGYISAKVRPEDLPGTIALFERTVKQFSPYPFAYQFLDDSFDQLYKREARLGEMFGFFTILALLIASLGLFGMAAFTAEQRTKEIGIRKVLGASVAGVVALLSKDFIRMVLVAVVIASPVAWYAMDRWLQDFVYHIHMQWWMFALAGALALLISLLTISFQSIKAALTNPVESLRNE